jgi:hypothetical protein
MACGSTAAGAAVAGAEAGAEAVCEIPAVVINPAPSAETRTRVRFMRSVVLLQSFDPFDRSDICYKDFAKTYSLLMGDFGQKHIGGVAFNSSHPT